MIRQALTMALMVVFCTVGAFAASEKRLMKDFRDGKTYKTVQIGSQIWMAENLNYNTGESFCYDNEEFNCAKYGRLYTWKAVQKVCPVGWHLPRVEEFERLIETVGGILEEDEYRLDDYYSGAGEKLKSTSGWKEYKGKKGNGDDAFGFSALPAGYRHSNEHYYHEGTTAYFWSSTETSDYIAYYMSLFNGDGKAELEYNFKDYGYSVRCVKD